MSLVTKKKKKKKKKNHFLDTGSGPESLNALSVADNPGLAGLLTSK
jgi:hypothetical protein